MSNEDEKLIQNVLLWGSVIGIGYFFVVKPLLNSIGVNPEDKADVDAQKLLPSGQNAFSPQFQPAISLFNANPSYDENDNILTMQQYYQAVKQLYDSNDSTLDASSKQIVEVAEGIYSVLHPGLSAAITHWTTDGPAIIALINQLSNQTQLSEVSAYYLANFGEDLLSALTGSLFQQGLTETDLATVIRYINNLPVQ